MLDLLHGVPFLLILIVAFGLAFDFTNGFHDTANAVATVISTRVLSPMVAIGMSAILNFCGALVSQKVAQTVAKGLVDTKFATQEVILAAIIGAIVWNLVTWYFGIPNSSSHALIGGLVGAALVFGGVHAVLWGGVLHKVVIPMVIFPVIGGAIGFAVMMTIYALFAHARTESVSTIFHNLQRLSAALVSFLHGQNDAQKTMGIITLALVTFHLQTGGAKAHIPLWVVLSCATAMGLGTATGGWRIIRTLGTKIIRLDPVNGFAAELSASVVLGTASLLGIPVSTTHMVSGSVFGVGMAKRLAGVRWNVAQRMVAAWVITLPAAALVSGLCLLAIRFVSHSTVAMVR